MAWKYPVLYDYGREYETLIREWIEASLDQNYFLHFAGSWYESEMFKNGPPFANKYDVKILNYYNQYIKQKVTGEPKGIKKAKLDR